MRIIKTILLLCLWIMSSCSLKDPIYPEVMSQALQCMKTQPDSALLYLSSLPDSTLQHEPHETRMYHALLTIMANDKLYNRHTSDSLINTIVQFYDEYGDLHKQMEAYYYLGSVYRDMNDAPRAVKAFLQVAKLGENTTEYDLMGKSYGQIGILLDYQDAHEEAEKAGKKELEFNILDKDSVGIGYALRNIGRTFHSREQIDSALFYYWQGYERGPEKIKNTILSEIPYLYFDNEEPEKAKSLILELFDKQKYSNNILLLLGIIYQQEEQLDKARYYIGKVFEKGTIYQVHTAYRKLFEIEQQLGNTTLALAYAKKCLQYQDSINKITKAETIAKIQALYDYQLYEEENALLQKKNQNHRYWIYLLSFGFAILIGCGFLYYSQLQRRKAKIIRQAKKLRLLEEIVHQKNSDFEEKIKQKITELEQRGKDFELEKKSYKQQLSIAEKELLQYLTPKTIDSEMKNSPTELILKKSDIYHYFLHWTNEPSTKVTEEKWKELRIAIDIAYYKFTDRLELLYPKLTDIELRICYLVKISIPIKNIALMLNRSNPAITNARSRMYKKITGKEGKSEDFDKFITDL